MTYIKNSVQCKFLNQGIQRGNLHNYEKQGCFQFQTFQEVIFLDLETLPKLVFTILVPLQILQDQL